MSCTRVSTQLRPSSFGRCKRLEPHGLLAVPFASCAEAASWLPLRTPMSPSPRPRACSRLRLSVLSQPFECLPSLKSDVKTALNSSEAQVFQCLWATPTSVQTSSPQVLLLNWRGVLIEPPRSPDAGKLPKVVYSCHICMLNALWDLDTLGSQGTDRDWPQGIGQRNVHGRSISHLGLAMGLRTSKIVSCLVLLVVCRSDFPIAQNRTLAK